MLNQIIQDAINEQINNELYSSYSYLSMSAYCEYKQFAGAASWMRIQSQEEYAHAMRLYDFLIARNGRVELSPIAQPAIDFESIPNVFVQALEQEKVVTNQIDALYELAFKEKAFAALVELEWFVQEQVDEEKAFTFTFQSDHAGVSFGQDNLSLSASDFSLEDTHGCHFTQEYRISYQAELSPAPDFQWTILEGNESWTVFPVKLRECGF